MKYYDVIMTLAAGEFAAVKHLTGRGGRVWLKARHSKCRVPFGGTVGSNPTLSAIASKIAVGLN